ncbi:MAG: hypothetical protein H0T46_11400 [Deltaproteobacteria bacterium]|nr:hypothetical protein [Deltaproteobacteria bacterium]
MGSAQHILDQVQSVQRLDALASDPGSYAEQLAAELGPAATLPELEARDAQLAAALGKIDAMIARAMRIRLEHSLSSETSIGPPTRMVFAQTVVSYDGKLDVLASRARDIAARGGARDADEVAELVTEAARRVLALRDGLRGAVLDLIVRLATAAVPDADRTARDRKLDDATRKRWSAARRDLEAISRNPEAVAAAPMTTRLAAWPEQIDEPDPEKEPDLADLLELE